MSSQIEPLWKSLKKYTNNDKLKVTAIISSIGFVIASGILLNKFRARKHDNIPMLAENECSFINGHLSMLMRTTRTFHQYLYNEIKKADFPSIVCLTRSPNKQILFVTNPVHVKYIFETQFDSAEKSKNLAAIYEELLGEGIFATNGEKWRFHRKIASRMFSMRNLKHFMCDSTINTTKMTMDKLKNYNNAMIDINDILGRFTLDTFCQIAFGQSIDSVADYPKVNEFGMAFDDIIERISVRNRDFGWRLKRILNIGNEAFIHSNHVIIRDFVENIIKNKNTLSSKMSDESGNANYDILSLYLKNNPKLTSKELYDIATNFIIAGRDTTRMLLSWWIWELCRSENKEILQNLYKEIDEFDEIPNFADFNQKFMFLEKTLCESLRLHPSVPFLGRECVKDIELPKIEDEDRSFVVREGNVVLVSNYVMARNPKVWGADACEFKPNRWTKGLNTFDQYKFSVFNINPRLCLGKKFAIQEAKIFGYYFLKNFEFEMKKGHVVQMRGGAILNMENGLPIMLKIRD